MISKKNALEQTLTKTNKTKPKHLSLNCGLVMVCIHHIYIPPSCHKEIYNLIQNTEKENRTE